MTEIPVNSRDESILDAAWTLVVERGLSSLTREAIAHLAGVSEASVSNFGRTSITNGPKPTTGYRQRVMRALMNQAIETGDTRMLRIGLADGCLRPEDVPVRLRGAAGL